MLLRRVVRDEKSRKQLIISRLKVFWLSRRPENGISLFWHLFSLKVS